MPSLRDLAFLGCRLLALLALFRILDTFDVSISEVLRVRADPLAGQYLGPGYLLWPIAVALANIAVFLFLWFGAASLSGRMVGGRLTGTPSGENKHPVWSRDGLLALAVTLLGLVLLALALPDAVMLVYAALFQGFTDVRGFLGLAASLGIGTLCLLGSGRVIALLDRYRIDGTITARSTDDADGSG
ncbi:hypothetical protein [Pelagibius sp.]|uniref:hypothetical protein n=1 Tax=Pelagibius sp. TaxID=1931238 RepID=UPI0026021680|nr:hypothetical protein [Pelagibius sp.]